MWCLSCSHNTWFKKKILKLFTITKYLMGCKLFYNFWAMLQTDEPWLPHYLPGRGESGITAGKHVHTELKQLHLRWDPHASGLQQQLLISQLIVAAPSQLYRHDGCRKLRLPALQLPCQNGCTSATTNAAMTPEQLQESFCESNRTVLHAQLKQSELFHAAVMIHANVYGLNYSASV